MIIMIIVSQKKKSRWLSLKQSKKNILGMTIKRKRYNEKRLGEMDLKNQIKILETQLI